MLKLNICFHELQNSALGVLLFCFTDVTEFRHAVEIDPRCFFRRSVVMLLILIAWVY